MSLFPFDEKNQKAICLVFCRRKIVVFTENSFFTFNELWRQQSDYQPESTSGNHDTKKVTEKTIIIFFAKNIFADYATDKHFKIKSYNS